MAFYRGNLGPIEKLFLKNETVQGGQKRSQTDNPRTSAALDTHHITCMSMTTMLVHATTLLLLLLSVINHDFSFRVHSRNDTIGVVL